MYILESELEKLLFIGVHVQEYNIQWRSLKWF